MPFPINNLPQVFPGRMDAPLDPDDAARRINAVQNLNGQDQLLDQLDTALMQQRAEVNEDDGYITEEENGRER
jgi:hypothetical protein